MKRYVAREATRLSKALAATGEPREAIPEGRVFVGGERALEDRELDKGDVVLIWEARSIVDTPSALDGVRIPRVFETEDIVVMDKPPELPTEPDHRGLRSLLHETANELHVPAATLHAHTRLDVGVSGLVLFSKSRAGHARVSSLTKERSLEKHYLAIVSGDTKDKGRIDEPIRKGGTPREAFTSFVTLGRTVAAGKGFSLVLVTPETGRLHQIRIHLSSLGTPILGDRKHGGTSSLVHADGRVVALDRIFLHAYALSLPREPALLASVPPIFRTTWRDLDGSPEAWKNLGAT